MRYIALLFMGMILLAGCLQERAAPIDEQGGKVFGRTADYDLKGDELPKYSSAHPAHMSADQDAKYVDDSHQSYGLSASVDPVASSDLPPIDPAKAPNTPAAVPGTNQELKTQQAADKAQAMRSSPAVAATDSLLPSGWSKDMPAGGDHQQKIAEAEAANKAGRELSGIRSAPVVSSAPAAPPDFVWPLKGEVLKNFQASGNESLAIAGRSGEPIRAAADGTVVYVGDKLQGYGTMVILQHAKGYVTTYGHLSDAVVAKGDTVISGQLIGFVGKTGNVTSPQLQFSLHQGGKALDPASLLHK